MQRIAQLLVIVGLIVILSSCQKPQKWTGNYYDYQCGFVVNGVEYHGNYYSGLTAGACYGFSKLSRDGVLVSILWEGFKISFSPWRNDNIWSDWNDYYHLYFELFIDPDTFKSSQQVYFTGGDYYPYPGKPVVHGYLVRTYRLVYNIVEGSITFGPEGFDDYHRNKDTVYFEFTAENESGEVLVVTDGYCKAFSEF